MIFLMPTSETPFYSQQVTLDGKAFALEYRFSQRENLWYLSISEADGAELVRGIKITVGFGLLRRYVDPRLPFGELVAVSNSSDDSPPGLLELGEGKRVSLYYVDASELKGV